MKIAILIDSSAGIKNINEYKDLFLVPLMITKENGEQIADDQNLLEDEFYELNNLQVLKTSQTITGNMLEKWDNLLKEYDQVVCLLISKGLSGQYNTFKMFSKEEEYNQKVFVIDTNGVSIIIKRQIEIVNKLIEQNKNGQEILDIMEEKYNNFKGYIIPKSLNQLVRGGRISKAAAGLAKILKITPILKYDGTIDKQGKTRTFKKAVEEAISLLRSSSNLEIIDVAYSKSSDEIINLVKEIIEKSGLKIGLFEKIPNVVTCHTGEETFAFLPMIDI
ncbi:DegV family protein [Spiroplasma taiwanense]|uniref:DegV family protein n=1 Tax=Spiroplasma taiwanense CT-1 TaxID=1276220 RepID=S5LYA3_9MOLU|nr:DegV family protein [Spiroplasma taiwanense]AGR41566.1 DegV family protein [Spiroplasma taiwanense CT-1]